MAVYEKRQISLCPVEDLAAYIDGELDAVRDSDIEAHLASCEDCTFELNIQKQFLCDVSSRLRADDAIDLPSDFARKIAVNAESTVSGLRRPRELFNAVFICAALALFALFALGTETGNFFDLTYGLFEQFAAVGSFVAQLLYAFFLGVAVVLRSFAARVGIEVVPAITCAILCLAVIFRYRRRVMRLLRV